MGYSKLEPKKSVFYIVISLSFFMKSGGCHRLPPLFLLLKRNVIFSYTPQRRLRFFCRDFGAFGKGCQLRSVQQHHDGGDDDEPQSDARQGVQHRTAKASFTGEVHILPPEALLPQMQWISVKEKKKAPT